MPDFQPSTPEQDEVRLTIEGASGPIDLSNFTEYQFSSHFLQPADAFSLTIGDESITDELRAVLVPGARVSLSLQGAKQATGFIDAIATSFSRDSGLEWRIRGRDVMGQVVDAHCDPTVSFKDGESLTNALKTMLAPFGFTSFEISDDANVDVRSQTSRHRVPRPTKRPRKKLTEYQLHRVRPYPREGVFEFCSRLAQHEGLWLWANYSGEKAIVDEPDFDQPASFKIRVNTHGTTNVLDGEVERDLTDQPTALVADSMSGRGDFGPGYCKAVLVNPAVDCTDPAVPSFKRYLDAGARLLEPDEFKGVPMIVPKHRVLYLHDNESQDQNQLENFIRRELAMLMRRSLTARYTVEGHGQQTGEGVRLWTPNTVVDVEDEAAGLAEPLYVLGRTFKKSRSGGTTTDLELIRLNTMVFSDTGR